jgi:hypothetical protein
MNVTPVQAAGRLAEPAVWDPWQQENHRLADGPAARQDVTLEQIRWEREID